MKNFFKIICSNKSFALLCMKYMLSAYHFHYSESRQSEKEGFTVFPLNSTELRSKPLQKIAFILGGGESLNRMNRSQWEQIDAGFSIGINRFFYNKYIPSILLVEGLKRKRHLQETPCCRVYTKALMKYIENNPSVKICVKSFSLLRFSDIFYSLGSHENVFSLPMLYLPGRTNSQVDIAQLYSTIFNILGFSRVAQARFSAFTAISLAVELGYKKIVLNGIDMVNSRYFFQSNDYEKPAWLENFDPILFDLNSDKTDPIHTKDNELHRTVHPFCPLQGDHVLCTYAELLKLRGIYLYTSFDNPLLRRSIPQFDWQAA